MWIRCQITRPLPKKDGSDSELWEKSRDGRSGYYNAEYRHLGGNRFEYRPCPSAPTNHQGNRQESQ